jgi:hypothetical protein
MLPTPHQSDFLNILALHNGISRLRAEPPIGPPGAEQTHRVLAMQATHSGEFVQNPSSFLPAASAATSSSRVVMLIHHISAPTDENQTR